MNESEKLSKSSAERSEREAYIDLQLQLAEFYANGLSIEDDLLKEAEQGNANVQYALAECYKSGKGVEKDLREAVHWFTQAAEQGEAKAQAMLGFCYKGGIGVKKDTIKALIGTLKWRSKDSKGQ